ncbi:hypothetical protein LSAT2_014857 [Lamellibrachia satsuma]|nr:hypothetical protein LSAT2_014857 [Lamellibrachia satsuma]
MIVTWITLVVLLSTLSAGGAISDLQFCTELCDLMFEVCVATACPTAPWPLPVPKHCIEKRTECIEKCIKMNPE